MNPETIDGWLFPEEGQLLQKYVQLTPHDILELGCYKGKSTVYMAQVIQGDKCLFSVDTFMSDNTTKNREDTLDIYLSNVKEYPMVYPLASTTQHIAKIFKHYDRTDDIGLLFIDADHSYEGVKHDFNNFSQYVPNGGFVIFHDAWGENGEEISTPWPGVTRFVQEIRENPDWIEVEKCRRCAVFKRVK